MSTSTLEERQEKLEKILSGVEGLPTLPTMLTEVNKMMMDPATTAKQMGALISSDPAITAKILRVVNSSFYGFPSRITTVTHAIVILGFNTVKSIVLSVSVFGSLQGRDCEGFNLTRFWEHSSAVGACTKVVAARAGFSAPEEFFIAGLLHDVGKIILQQHLPEDFARALALSRERKISLREAEEQVFGVNHAEVGGHLLETWKLSKGLVNTVRYHHNPALAGDELKVASVVHMGDILARCLCLGDGGDPYVPPIAEAAWEALGFSEEIFPALLKECWEETDKARVYLDFLES